MQKSSQPMVFSNAFLKPSYTGGIAPHSKKIGEEDRVLARIKFKRPKKHVATTMTHRLGEIFVKCQRQAFSFNKRETKVYCYAFLHVLKREIHAYK
jgi:hypothetical protein